MIKILGNLPSENIGVALSGGIDSMCVANFLLTGRKNFTAFYFNHGTVNGEKAEKFVRHWCQNNEVDLVSERLEEEYEPTLYSGPQNFYREHRYRFFKKYSQKYNIILAHHLDDVLETWLFSNFHGKAKIIPYKHEEMVRPFLLTTKSAFRVYAERHDVPWLEDQSNATVDYMRNRIRHLIVPEVEIINPGIRKHVARLVNDMYNRYPEIQDNC